MCFGIAFFNGKLTAKVKIGKENCVKSLEKATQVLRNAIAIKTVTI